VSTFGGPGYLVPGLSDLKRDDLGNCWLYMDREPYAILSYNSNLEYRLALLTPGRVLAHDLDADGNLYLLHPGNWVSKHGPMGEALGAWELPLGRGPGEFVSASGLAIDRDAGLVYIADEKLGRVQRFDLALALRPLPETTWGWIGREDLAYTEAGEYRRTIMYYQLDRPRQLCLDGMGHLFVSCERYVTRIDLGTGLQVDFGRSPVLGWGGSFTDSADSRAAALDGHWQRHWLAGVDSLGNVYISDRENEFVVDSRLQVFGPDGVVLHTFDLERGLRDASGAPVYISAVRGLACSADGIWLVDAAGRVYQSPPGVALRSGGRLYLGPGAAGRQFDLTQASQERFRVALQAGRVKHRWEGRLLAPRGDGGTRNCEREGTSLLGAGARSMWAPARLGEPFGVRLFDEHGVEIPAGQYRIQFEEQAGLFGTRYDYFRVTNVSGKRWRDVRFVAETIE
jgi:hypothetical protein